MKNKAVLVLVAILMIILATVVYTLPSDINTYRSDNKNPLISKSGDSRAVMDAKQNGVEGQKEADNSAPPPTTISLSFAGDVVLHGHIADLIEKHGYNWPFKNVKNIFASSDISMVNLETPISDRGVKERDKEYTFRAKPENIKVLSQAGIKIVTLANNHSLDFGTDALLDTFNHLKRAGISYTGAGEDIDKASAPVFFNKNGIKIAILASSRVIPFTTWAAAKKKTGVATTYDATRLKKEISNAKKNADIVVVYVHWGKEYYETPVEYQKSLARMYIDEGADMVIGSHPHVLQGFEYYKDRIIAYSLGNFVFNSASKDTMILKIQLEGEKVKQVQVIPCVIENFTPNQITDAGKMDLLFKKLEALSINVSIDSNGVVGKK